MDLVCDMKDQARRAAVELLHSGEIKKDTLLSPEVPGELPS